jgi:hypothetical protein
MSFSGNAATMEDHNKEIYHQTLILYQSLNLLDCSELVPLFNQPTFSVKNRTLFNRLNLQKQRPFI